MARHFRRQAGNAVTVALLLLFVAGGALGLNYVRNYKIDQQQETNNRPYARYKLGDLQVLAEGYRMELAAAEKRHGSGRVQTRERHHFSDQIDEFERVQKAARRSRDKAFDLADMRRELQVIEAEQQLRGPDNGELAMHFTRMFRL